MELLTDLKVYLIVWALKLMNVVDRVLQRFGIRMVRLSRELVLKGDAFLNPNGTGPDSNDDAPFL